MMSTRRFLVALLILALVPQQACRTSSSADANKGSLKVHSGTVTVEQGGKTETVSKGGSLALTAGAVLKTDAEGVAMVSWGKQSHVLHENGELRFDKLAETPAGGVRAVSLVKGMAAFFLPKGEPESDYKFQAATHTIVAAVKGTAFRMFARTESAPAKVDVMRGEVDVVKRAGDGSGGALVSTKTDKPEATLAANTAGDFPDTGPTKVTSVDQKNQDAQMLIYEALLSQNIVATF
jgi:hypothetical protein